MKSFKSILVVLFLATTMVANAQTTLRDALKAFIQASPSTINMTPQTMGPALRQLNIGVIKNYDEEKSNQLVNQYMEERFLDNIIDALLPYCQQHVTIDNLKQLTDQMLTPEGKVFQEHQSVINSNTNFFAQVGQDVALKIIAGETPAPIEPVGCPESYKQLFYQYFEQSNLMASIDPLYDSLARGSLNDTQKEMMEKLKQYFSVNMPVLYLNVCHGTMTEDDLRFGIQLYKTEAWKNQMEAMKEAMGHTQEMGLSIVMGYLGWLKEQGVETNMLEN